jgi:hypothetical protein
VSRQRPGETGAAASIDLWSNHYKEKTMHRSTIALALLLMTPLASAQVYKWKDASGVEHYSQTPPSSAIKFKEVKPATEVPPTPAASTAEPAKAATPQPTTTTVADTPENRSKLCTSLQTNLTALQGAAPVVMDQGGKQTTLDAGARAREASEAQARYQLYCVK